MSFAESVQEIVRLSPRLRSLLTKIFHWLNAPTYQFYSIGSDLQITR